MMLVVVVDVWRVGVSVGWRKGSRIRSGGGGRISGGRVSKYSSRRGGRRVSSSSRRIRGRVSSSSSRSRRGSGICGGRSGIRGRLCDWFIRYQCFAFFSDCLIGFFSNDKSSSSNSGSHYSIKIGRAHV